MARQLDLCHKCRMSGLTLAPCSPSYCGHRDVKQGIGAVGLNTWELCLSSSLSLSKKSKLSSICDLFSISRVPHVFNHLWTMVKAVSKNLFYLLSNYIVYTCNNTLGILFHNGYPLATHQNIISGRQLHILELLQLWTIQKKEKFGPKDRGEQSFCSLSNIACTSRTLEEKYSVYKYTKQVSQSFRKKNHLKYISPKVTIVLNSNNAPYFMFNGQ